MSATFTLTERQKRRVADLAVGAVLLGAIVVTGCDAPGASRRAARGEDPRATAMVPSQGESVGVTLAAATTVSPAAGPVVTGPVSYEVAEAAYRDRRYPEAAGLFTRYVEDKPTNPWGHYMLGLSAWKAGQPAQAEAAFRRALELDPKHVKSYLNLSRVLLETGRPADALERVETASELDSTSSVALRLRGRALAGLGRVEEAADAYRRAIVLDDTDVWSMNNLGLLYFEQGWFDEALFPLARAVELDSTAAVFLNNLGMLLEHTGRFTQATELYRRATVADATHVKAAANLARAEGRADDPLVEPADVGLLAREFVRQVETWKAWEVPVVGIREP